MSTTSKTKISNANMLIALIKGAMLILSSGS
jgi:hypothetical protein